MARGISCCPEKSRLYPGKKPVRPIIEQELRPKIDIFLVFQA